jgi:hypothetical protein
MRTIVPFLSVVTLLMAPAAFPAAAMAVPGSAGMRSAVETVNLVETVACWRYGWRGWGAYPGCVLRPGYAVVPPVYPAPVYVPPPAYAPAGRCWIGGTWRVC